MANISLAQPQTTSEFGLTAGIHSGQAETDLPRATISSKLGFQVGALAWLSIYHSWSLRTGFLYSQRPGALSNTSSGDVNIEYAYFDVPLTASLRFSDFASLFAGPLLAFNQSKDVICSAKPNCTAIDVNAFLVPIQMGLDFKFAPQVGAEIYVEVINGDLSANVSNMKTVGANLLFFFE